MGGCRCTFRDCENGTASRKELHYFRYPVRDPDRLRLWARLANRTEFLDLPKEKLVNKVVCQEHFERGMFMNYLCDRLSRLAVPRLMPQSDGSALNVETGDVQWMYEDNGSTEAAMESAKPAPVPYFAPVAQKTQISIRSVETLNNLDGSSSPEPAQKKIKILNSETMPYTTPCKVIRISSSRNNSEQPIRLTRVGALRKVCLPKPKPSAVPEQTDLQNDNETHTLLEIQEDGGTTDDQEETTHTFDILPSSGDNKIETSPKIISAVVSPRTNPPPVPVPDPMLVKMIEQNNSEITELKQMVRELLDRPPPEPQPVTVLAPSAVAQKVVMEKGPALTKAQLFCSIKRYLNPTMVTLLRMELFSGSAERQWKPDEKSLAVDLLNIGEEVYDHFTDEFRFRLPPKVDAIAWKETGEIDADDAC